MRSVPLRPLDPQMSGQKRSLPRPQRPSVAQSVAAGDPPSPAAQPQEQHDEDEEGLEEMAEGEEKTPTNPPQQQDGAGGDGASLSPSFLPLFPFDLMPWRRRLFHCTGCDGEGDGSQSEDDLTDEGQYVPCSSLFPCRYFSVTFWIWNELGGAGSLCIRSL